MSRAIDAEALKADFRANFGSVHDSVIACQIVDRQPTITPQNEWVSVEDRRPASGQNVIATNGSDVGEA